jgi:hypothetical protein
MEASFIHPWGSGSYSVRVHMFISFFSYQFHVSIFCINSVIWWLINMFRFYVHEIIQIDSSLVWLVRIGIDIGYGA